MYLLKRVCMNSCSVIQGSPLPSSSPHDEGRKNLRTERSKKKTGAHGNSLADRDLIVESFGLDTSSKQQSAYFHSDLADPSTTAAVAPISLASLPEYDLAQPTGITTMDSNNDDSDDSNNNPARHILMTDMLTIRTSWIRTVHRAAQAYLHQMTSSSTDEGVPIVVSASNITEQDILYAYIWHLLTRTRVRGIGNSISNQDSDNSDFSDNDPTEVVKLFTTAHVCDVLLPAIATVPLHSFFLRPSITDETGIPYLRRYALLALAIRSAIEAAVREPSVVGEQLGLLRQHEGQDVARRMMGAKRDWIGSCEGGLCIVSLDEAGKGGLEGMEMRCGGSGRSEVGSDFSSMDLSGEETEMGVGIHTMYKPSTPARGDYHAVVLPVRKGDGKWGVQLHLHPLYRQWLRRWMEENPGEAEMVPRV